MPDYLRNRVPGGTFFFTVNLWDRRSDLLVTHIEALRDAVRRVRARAAVWHRRLGIPSRPCALFTPARHWLRENCPDVKRFTRRVSSACA
jgi:hypothetical protein